MSSIQYQRETVTLDVDGGYRLTRLSDGELIEEHFESDKEFTKRRAELDNRLPAPGFYVGHTAASASVLGLPGS